MPLRVILCFPEEPDDPSWEETALSGHRTTQLGLVQIERVSTYLLQYTVKGEMAVADIFS